MIHSIELDCPPGNPRPDNLIGAVIEGTGLVLPEPSSQWFGNWCWEWPDVSDEEWVKVQEIVKPRIKALYNHGVIRYGSW